VRIAVNTRFLLPGRLDGIGWFTYETLKRITTAHPEHTFYFLFDRPFNRRFIFSDNIHPCVVYPPARHPFLWYVWFQHSIPRVLNKIKPDVFFSPDGFIPLKHSIPVVSVIHDLNFEHYPKDLPPAVRYYYRHYFKTFATEAKEIITVSRFSKDDIVKQYQVDPEKIHVVYNGVNEKFQPLSEEDKKRIRSENTGGSPYILHTGSLLPRKNISRLLQAFDLFRKDHPDFKLILAGGKISGIRDIYHQWHRMKFRHEVIFTGYIEAEHLRRITAAAETLVLVSYFEGFGLPLLEAMACHVPVVCGNVTALPEIAGEAVLLTDPFSVSGIAKNLTKIIDNASLRRNLISRGQERVAQFNWDSTAESVWNVLTKQLSGH